MRVPVVSTVYFRLRDVHELPSIRVKRKTEVIYEVRSGRMKNFPGPGFRDGGH